MSYAMDDFGLSLSVDAVRKTKPPEETRKVDKSTESKKTDPETEKTDTGDAFEIKSQNANMTIDMQEKSSQIDVVQISLDKISSSVDNIKKTVESDASDEEVKQKTDENYKNIQQAAKESSFNEQQTVKEKNVPSEESDASKTGGFTSLEDLKVTDIPQIDTSNREESVKKLNEITAEIKAKKDEFKKEQQDLEHKITSLVELKQVSENENDREINSEKLKAETIQNIKDNPHKSVQMHIKHIDRNLLLAMLSLRSA